MESGALHPFRGQTSEKEHFPPFSNIFDNENGNNDDENTEEDNEEEERDMEMSIDLVATLRGDQLDPSSNHQNRHSGPDWDTNEEDQCSDFFRDEKRMEMLKTPLHCQTTSKQDEIIRLLRDLSTRVSIIEKHLHLGKYSNEMDQKVHSSPNIQKSPVMRRRKYTPSHVSSTAQPQFGLSPIPSMFASPAQRPRSRTNLAKTPVAPWLMPEAPSVTKKSLSFIDDDDDDDDEEDEEEDGKETSIMDLMELKVSRRKQNLAASLTQDRSLRQQQSSSVIKRDALYWRERLGSTLTPSNINSRSFRRSWG